MEFLESLDIIQSLDSLFTKVAEALGLGIDLIREQGVYYIMMYGRYELARTMATAILIAFVGSLIIGIILWLSWEDSDEVSKKIGMNVFLFGLSIGFAVAIYEFTIYIVAPEIYSIKAVLELLGTL